MKINNLVAKNMPKTGTGIHKTKLYKNSSRVKKKNELRKELNKLLY